MGSIIVTAPDIPDGQLVFDESETRDILAFFWPVKSLQIKAMAIDNDTRRFAQMLLVAAIDASYAMGFVEALFKATFWPSKNLTSLGKKLARNFVKHWWKHATQKDLMEAKIYETVRRQVSNQYRSQFELRLEGIASAKPPRAFYVAQSGQGAIWR